MTNQMLDMVTPYALVSDFRDQLPAYIEYLRAKARPAAEPTENIVCNGCANSWVTYTEDGVKLHLTPGPQPRKFACPQSEVHTSGCPCEACVVKLLGLDDRYGAL